MPNQVAYTVIDEVAGEGCEVVDRAGDGLNESSVAVEIFAYKIVFDLIATDWLWTSSTICRFSFEE